MAEERLTVAKLHDFRLSIELNIEVNGDRPRGVIMPFMRYGLALATVGNVLFTFNYYEERQLHPEVII